MNTTPTELSVESIEAVLVEKEAALAKEQAMLEGLKSLLSRMRYELVPIETGKRRCGGRGASNPTVASSTPEGSRRGRPRKSVAASSRDETSP